MTESKRIKVLIVEDNSRDAFLLREMLDSAEGSLYFVTQAEQLEKALLFLRSESYDVVLLKHELPDNRGLGTLRELVSAVPSVPVVLFTGLANKEVGLQAVNNGAQDYLVRSRMDGNVLERVIGYAIERKKAEQALRASEEKYHSLFNNAEVGIFRAKSDGFQILDVNHKCAEILERPREEIIGNSFSEFWADKREWEEMRLSLGTQGSVSGLECQVLG